MLIVDYFIRLEIIPLGIAEEGGALFYRRQLKLEKLLQRKSYFLFGARSTGKSFWIQKSLDLTDVYSLNLLQSSFYLRLSEDPGLLESLIEESRKTTVVIDEVQRLPILLNEVHRLIENRGYRFLLTGSSARSLKRERANMLGGRAGLMNFYPLSWSEIPDFSLNKFLNFGGLPRVYLSEDPTLELDSYVNNYLEQEIKIEANVRSLAPFHRFLKSAALNNGELIAYANISNDSGVPASTVKDYYEILKDSLIGYPLEPWMDSKKRKAIQTAKFYFFDPGVCHFIQGIKGLDRHSNHWGKAFEQFILMELRAYNSYHQRRQEICFWRSVNKQEVDFVIGDEIAIEVKSTKRVSKNHLNGLEALKEENVFKRLFIVSDDPLDRVEQKHIHLLHWKTFLKRLWDGEIF